MRDDRGHLGTSPVVRPAAAATVVFLAAAAVLVLEILTARLMAPYLGVSLDTYTGIIGTVLAGISAGSWIGGRAADRYAPRLILGPILILGGFLALISPTLVNLLGPEAGGDGIQAIVGLAFCTVFFPALVLSAVTPVVVKLQLTDLNATGTAVGRCRHSPRRVPCWARSARASSSSRTRRRG